MSVAETVAEIDPPLSTKGDPDNAPAAVCQTGLLSTFIVSAKTAVNPLDDKILIS